MLLLSQPKPQRTGVFPILTLHHERFLFNKQIKISNDSGELANDARALLIAVFLHQVHFDQLLRDNLCFKDGHKYRTFPLNDLFKQLLFQLLTEYHQDQSANALSHNFNLSLS
ncbi:hypothetical protein LAC02_51060 [Ligilactobacillus acidipiscis]|nr:hypothetical protein LAC02_51060 [Ligilactobacillus acidipiscis]